MVIVDKFSTAGSFVTMAIDTVFIRIVATAIINFSLAWVWLLIEGGSYSWAALIDFGLILDGVVYKNRNTDYWFTGTSLQDTMVIEATTLQ